LKRIGLKRIGGSSLAGARSPTFTTVTLTRLPLSAREKASPTSPMKSEGCASTLAASGLPRLKLPERIQGFSAASTASLTLQAGNRQPPTPTPANAPLKSVPLIYRPAAGGGVPREWKALWVKRDLYEYLMGLKRENGYRSIDELLRALLDYFPPPEKR